MKEFLRHEPLCYPLHRLRIKVTFLFPPNSVYIYFFNLASVSIESQYFVLLHNQWDGVMPFKNKPQRGWGGVRWQRSRTGRPLSPSQIPQKNILTLSKLHKTTSECWQRTSGNQKSRPLSLKTVFYFSSNFYFYSLLLLFKKKILYFFKANTIYSFMWCGWSFLIILVGFFSFFSIFSFFFFPSASFL